MVALLSALFVGAVFGAATQKPFLSTTATTANEVELSHIALVSHGCWNNARCQQRHGLNDSVGQIHGVLGTSVWVVRVPRQLDPSLSVSRHLTAVEDGAVVVLDGVWAWGREELWAVPATSNGPVNNVEQVRDGSMAVCANARPLHSQWIRLPHSSMDVMLYVTVGDEGCVDWPIGTISISSQPLVPLQSFFDQSSSENTAPGTSMNKEYEKTPSSLKTQITQMLHSLNGTSRVEYYATYLTGEHPDSPIRTRQSYSSDGHTAALWIRSQLDRLGFRTQLDWYDRETDGKRWNPNVVAEWPASGIESGEIVVVGAHYDDRQRNMYSTQDRAPGANDDGNNLCVFKYFCSCSSNT
jgi:hypothetical protein